MMVFNHPNVLSLIGVCVDAGKAPYLVMPYMANGSLLSYLRNERPNLTIADEAGDELVFNSIYLDTRKSIIDFIMHACGYQ